MMGVLTPLFLLAAAAVIIPLILHLFHRQDRKRLVFPALRYLQRMNKDHARKIRLRQLLLLLLRMGAILFLVIAGSRPFLRNSQGMHEPTATVIILDNSMSSGFIRDDQQILENLKELALQGAKEASPEDRLWLIKAAEPWETATTGSLTQVQEAIQATGVIQTASNLTVELERAVSILSSSNLPLKEIHLVSDLQVSAFRNSSNLNQIVGIPLIISTLPLLEGANNYLDSLVIGDGLAPLANEASHITVHVAGTDDQSEIPLRLFINDRIYGLSNGKSGSSTILPIGPFPSSQVTGHIERDPDFLSIDDRRFFVFQARPPSRIATSGEIPFFLSEALPVLVNRERIQLHPRATAEVHISIGGTNLNEVSRANLTSVVIPSFDPALLPALNRSLSDTGIPWRYEVSNQTGDSQLLGWERVLDMSGVIIRRHYQLIPTNSTINEGVEIRLSSGEPWLVKGLGPQGPYTLVASALDEESTNLPLTATLIPFLDWISSGHTNSTNIEGNYTTGDPLLVPPGIISVMDPSGTKTEVSEGQLFNRTGSPGIYHLIGSDSTVTRVAYNVPTRESLLESINTQMLEDRFSGITVLVDDADEWKNSVFVTRKGVEIWKWFVLMTFVTLVAETFLAASGLKREKDRADLSPSAPNS